MKSVLGLDVSTKTIGVALFDIETKKLLELTHVTPNVKPKPECNFELLLKKVDIFKEFVETYKNMGIEKITIEEPLLSSNNVRTVATLLRFNGMISKCCYDIFGIVPEFISSYDARAYAFPELMSKRTHKKNGEPLSESAVQKNKPVLFGSYPYDVDKKMVIWEKVCELEPQLSHKWLYTKHQTLKKENFDMTDAFTATLGFMRKEGLW